MATALASQIDCWTGLEVRALAALTTRGCRRGPTRAAVIEARLGTLTRQFVNAVRYYTAPPGPTFISRLDKLILDHDQQASLESTLQRGDVLEIQGGPSTGKTEVRSPASNCADRQLCIFLAITTLLPATWQVELKSTSSSRPAQTVEIALSGRNRSVVYFDSDGALQVGRIAVLIRSYLLRRIRAHTDKVPSLYNAVPTRPTAIDEMVNRSLGRLHLFRPSSTVSLAATLTTLPAYLQTHDRSDVELGMVIVDSLSAFHWQDAFALESDPASAHALRYVVQALGTLRRILSPVFVVTNWALARFGSTPFYRQHLHAPWPTPFVPPSSGAGGTRVDPSEAPFEPTDPLPAVVPVTLHLTLLPGLTAPFPPGASLESVRGERGVEREQQRREAVTTAILRKPGVLDGQELGRFGFRIDAVEGLVAE